jgi:hypothetical protein
MKREPYDHLTLQQTTDVEKLLNDLTAPIFRWRMGRGVQMQMGREMNSPLARSGGTRARNALSDIHELLEEYFRATKN